MSRRSNRKTFNPPSYAEVEEDSRTVPGSKVGGVTPKKKGRQAVGESAHESVPTVPTKEPASRLVANDSRIEPTTGEAADTVVEIKKPPKKRNIKAQETAKLENPAVELPVRNSDSPQKAKAKRKAHEQEKEDAERETDTKNIKKKRKTKEEKDAEAMPLASRTPVQALKRAMFIGAHVSGAGGVHNSITNAEHIGANSFALFLKSQRKWVSPPLSNETRDQFHSLSKEHKFDPSKYVLPHGSYLVNLAQAEPEKAKQAYDCFLDDLQRCEALGITLYNFHPGNTGPHPRAEAIARIAANLNKAHKATKNVVILLENMAGTGNVIGSTFEDLRDIIALIDDKSRIGVCIDTCHTFAAGYDLRSPEDFKLTIEIFSKVIGLQYLKALHLNDSKAPFASHRDLHANIGTGFLGLRAFHNIVNCAAFEHLPMVLETPIERKGDDGKVVEDKSVWATEIKLLEGLIGADPESQEYKADEQRLQDQGAEERKKYQQQVDKKSQKTIDSMFKLQSKTKKKKIMEVQDDSGSEGEGNCNH